MSAQSACLPAVNPILALNALLGDELAALTLADHAALAIARPWYDKCRDCNEEVWPGSQGKFCARCDIRIILESTADDWDGGEATRLEELRRVCRYIADGGK